MTERERFIKPLRREPVPGYAPTFELVFFLTMEAFGRVHPSQRSYGQWRQKSGRERQLHLFSRGYGLMNRIWWEEGIY